MMPEGDTMSHSIPHDIGFDNRIRYYVENAEGWEATSSSAVMAHLRPGETVEDCKTRLEQEGVDTSPDAPVLPPND